MPHSFPPRRSSYLLAHLLTIPTRWRDNDLYGHVNNVVYYSYFDTVINDYLIREGGLDIHDGEVIGICAESTCQFKASFTFPRSEEHTSELQSLMRISYAVFCLKKKTKR